MIALRNIVYRIDLIGWLDLLSGLSRHGRLHRIGWVGASGYRIETILRQYGIHAYGRGVQIAEVQDGEQKRHEMRRWLHVNHKQAAWAEYVLLCAGVSLTTPLCDPANARRAAQKTGTLPKAWQQGRRSKPQTLVEVVFDWFSNAL